MPSNKNPYKIHILKSSDRCWCGKPRDPRYLVIELKDVKDESDKKYCRWCLTVLRDEPHKIFGHR